MEFLHSAILGLVEGLTEFVPVSSSGHLIIARKIIGEPITGTIAFDAIIQLAAGLALVCYFWRDIMNLILALVSFLRRQESISDSQKIYRRMILPLIIGTIPAVILGLLLEKDMDTIFRGTHVVAITLILGAILFYFAEKFAKVTSGRPSERLGTPLSGEGLPEVTEVSLKQGLYIGLFQCLALLPGFSRSGATIAGGLFNKLSREEAARFSFLMAIPIILGSGLKSIWDIHKTGALGTSSHSILIASLFAFVSGLLSVHLLIKFLKNHSLNGFGIYRILLAIVILIWL